MKRLAIVLAAGLLLVLSGVALASIPDSSGVIHGCYKTGNPNRGSVIVIDTDAGQSCPSGYATLNWNQTGPQGPAGAAGTSYNFKVYSNAAQDLRLAPGASNIYEYGCPGLDYVVRDISAGWSASGDVAGQTYPVGDADGLVRAWRYSLRNNGSIESVIRLYVVCAEPTS